MIEIKQFIANIAWVKQVLAWMGMVPWRKLIEWSLILGGVVSWGFLFDEFRKYHNRWRFIFGKRVPEILRFWYKTLRRKKESYSTEAYSAQPHTRSKKGFIFRFSIRLFAFFPFFVAAFKPQFRIVFLFSASAFLTYLLCNAINFFISKLDESGDSVEYVHWLDSALYLMLVRLLTFLGWGAWEGSFFYKSDFVQLGHAISFIVGIFALFLWGFPLFKKRYRGSSLNTCHTSKQQVVYYSLKFFGEALVVVCGLILFLLLFQEKPMHDFLKWLLPLTLGNRLGNFLDQVFRIIGEGFDKGMKAPSSTLPEDEGKGYKAL